ncbi:50S ribosomal protein L19 [Candidatus Parcubacteria bacterium]|nr:50S ribosomal protein L19 [Candidatus Parcubacteria bacterium]
MTTKAEKFNKEQIKQGRDEIQAGDTVKIYQKTRVTGGKDKNKEKIQIFEGLVLARKHGKGINATITVRKVIAGIGVEKILPIHSPNIDKIEIMKRGKARRAKLYYLRTAKGRKARLKRKKFTPAPEPAPTPAPEPKPASPAETPSEAKAEAESEQSEVQPPTVEQKPATESKPEKQTEENPENGRVL